MSTGFPREALAAAGHRFEQARGQRIQLADFDEIMRHKLTQADPDELAEEISHTLLNDSPDSSYRQSAYFVLGKKLDTGLVPFFNQRLKAEVESGDAEACYQILIALDDLDIGVFPQERDAPSVAESDLNLRDANAYLAVI